ncbi:phosphonate ABC transporter ATP-binding protein [Zwartia sp.]|uniref:phosphonate ABC transporter ATP-binding protein n=1 Tax=Zwartia sp. TaxID=2978004 RepID=UPI003BB1F7AC
MNTPLLDVKSVSKTFKSHSFGRPASFKAVDEVSFSVNRGESVALLGASGSGKSTLIRLLCGLEKIDAGNGSISVDTHSFYQGTSFAPDIRETRKSIGVVFQQFNLVGQLDVITNVLIGCLANKSAIDVLLRRFTEAERVAALECLDKVGLGPQAYQRASTLSGGQQQRVAVARALLRGAELLLADEPVASLDPTSAKKVMDVLFGLTQDLGMTLIVSLHQISIAQTYCHRALGMRKGRLIYDGLASELSVQRLQALYGADAQEIVTDTFNSPQSSTQQFSTLIGA